MSNLSDFSKEELNAISQTLEERYGGPKNTELADVELRLDPADKEVTSCPAVYWEDKDCHFVICRIGKEKFYCQFYYRGHEQFGTDIPEYNDLIECVVTLLQVQADHEAQRTDSEEKTT